MTDDPPQPPCPDPSRLAALLDGRLVGDELAAVQGHLEDCDHCRLALDEMAADDPDWSAMRDLGRAGGPDEPALRRVIAALEEGATVSGDEPRPDDGGSRDALGPPNQPGHLGRLGHYEVIEVVGRGGMGVVLKAFDETLHRVVAVKLLAPHLAASAAARTRFVGEARAVAAVHDDHVVTIHAVEEAGGLPYLVMEYISGESLERRLARCGTLDLKRTLRIGMQAAAALAAAHARGLVHRDVKPGNILLENGVERVKITDFGLAAAVDDGGLARCGLAAGTPGYMAPEQARGGPVDRRADLFGLGGVLYAMCTGSPPRSRDAWPRPLRGACPDVPDWLAAIVDRLLAEDPADRFPTAAEVADQLGRHLARLEAGGPPATEARPRRRLALVAAGAALLVAGGLLMWAKPRDRGDAPGPGRAAVAPTPAAPSPAARGPRVLFVLAQEGFYYPDYGPVRSVLHAGGVEVVVDSKSRAEARHDPRGPGRSVVPDLALAEAAGGDYDALVFAGGAGIESLVGDADARRLVAEALAAGKVVAALSTGPVVLADAGVLRGARATCFRFGQPPKVYIRRLERAGATWVDEPVVVSGRIITARDPHDAVAFGRAVLERLTRAP